MYAFTTGIAEAVPALGVPLYLADLVVLTKNQLVMSYRIALSSGKHGAPRELLGEVLGVIGGAFLLRQGARQLVSLVPVAGIVPKVAVAYAGTLAIGKAVVAWAAYGAALERGTVRSRLPAARRSKPRDRVPIVGRPRRTVSRPSERTGSPQGGSGPDEGDASGPRGQGCDTDHSCGHGGQWRSCRIGPRREPRAPGRECYGAQPL
jgi:uncharacterized protein (DUF697 family)